MNQQTIAPAYITSLLKPTASKGKARRVWSIDLETVWLPFFTATNTEGLTLIPHEALGCPLRLAYNKDGSPKFNTNTGRPVIRVAKDINEQVRLVRENFVAGLQAYAGSVRENNAEGYSQEIRLNAEAGSPIMAKDTQALQSAIEQAMSEAMAKGEQKGIVQQEGDLVAVTA